MRITQEADYALRILVYLARKNNVCSAKTISDEMRVPPRFTLKILSKLVSGGLARSFMGASGGYTLNRDPAEITLLHIIEAIDGEIAINRCLKFDLCPTTQAECKCNIRAELSRINDRIVAELSGTKLADIYCDCE